MSLEWLSIVAKHHKEYVTTVKNWGGGDYSEDIVQEMYIRLSKATNECKIISNGEVCKAYIWFALRSTYIDSIRAKKKYTKVNIDDLLTLENTNNEELFEALDKIDSKITEIIDSFHWYDKMLFNLYTNTDKSMRQISTDTGISLSSIFTTISKCTERLKDELNEDFYDYRNEEYERV